MTMTTGQPDFWGFLQQQAERWRDQLSNATGDQELQVVRDSWLNPQSGILVRLKDDPYFALATPSAQKVFINYMRDRIELDTRYWRDALETLRDALDDEPTSHQRS
jgi:hypothetical protein